MFTIARFALWPVLAAPIVSQTLTEQAKTRSEYRQASLVQGLKNVCDASLDAVPLLSKLSDSAAVLQWALWLKYWSTDQTSKKALADLPFQGEGLFGITLDYIIKNFMGGKSTLLPLQCHQA